MGTPCAACWLVLVQPKGIAVEDHMHAHKALQAQELLEEMHGLMKPLGVSDTANINIVAKEGGVMAALNVTDVCTAVVGDRICVFQGQLRNLEKLAYKYGPHAGARPMSPTDSSRASSVNGDAASDAAAHQHEEGAAANTTHVTADGHTVNAAEMILHMYEALGVALLAHLVGRFSLCMYDAKQMRVLAARDGSGAFPVLQARTARDSLVIATNPMLLACCHDTLEFSPGHFKYGWHAEPRLFTPQDAIAHGGRRSIDQGYSGVNRRTSVDAGSRRTSIDANGHGHGSLGRRTSIETNHRRTSIESNGASGSWQGRHGHHMPTGNGTHEGSAGSRRSLDGVRGSGARGHGHAAAAPHLPTLPEKQEEGAGKVGAKHHGNRRHSQSGSHPNGNGSNGHANGGHKAGPGAAPKPAAGKQGGNGAGTASQQQQQQQQQGGGSSSAGAGAAAAAAAHGLSHLNINAKEFVPFTAAAR